MKWSGQHIYDLVSKFRNTVDFSEDVTFYQPVNNANPKISIGASDDERLQIGINYKGTTTQSLQQVLFTTYTESGTANDGEFIFQVDEVSILDIDDGGLDLRANMGISIAGTDILTDSSGTATLSNIDALDATTISTLNAALTAGDITEVTAGDGLSGGGTSGDVSLNVDATQAGITGLGTITSGTWQSTTAKIANTFLDADTAHLTTDQTFTGAKTFSAATTTFTSATADSPLIKVLNTTDDDQASQLVFEKLRDDDAVASGQNLGEIWFKGQDNAQNTEDYAYIVGKIDVGTGGQESGKLQFGVAAHDGSTRTAMTLTGGSEAAEVDATIGLGANSVVTIPGRIAGNVTGDLTGNADTVTTNANLTGHVTSSGNATTLAATQPNITSIGTDGQTLAILGDTIALQNTTTNKPDIQLVNKTDDATGPYIYFYNQRLDSTIQDGEDDDVLGTLRFMGYDDGTPTLQNYANIYADIHDATSDEESGRLTFQVANHDGGLGSGLILTGGSANNEVDVTLGLGASSVTTVAGDLAVTGSITTTGQRQLTHYMIKDDIGTGVVYIGLNDADAENSNVGNKLLPLLAPVAGKLLKIFLRTSTNMSGTNLTWRLYTRTTSSTTAGAVGEIGAQTGAGPTNSTMTTYDFTSSLDSGTNVVAAGDKLQISVQSDATSGDQNFFITCLWEWDLS